MIFCLIAAHCAVLPADDLPWVEEGHHGYELEIVTPFLPDNPVILEAGGHYGEDTVIFAKRWPRSTIYTFEPCPTYYSKLEGNVAGIPNIHSYPFGLYSKTGNYPFYVSRNWDGASSLLEDNFLPVTVYNDYAITVFCKNLDEWALEVGVDHLDYLWLDMEGTELAVLQSAPRILQTVRALSLEMNYREFRKGMPHFQEVKQFLESQGFTLHKIWGLPGGPPGTWQSTGVFIRTELLAEQPLPSFSLQEYPEKIDFRKFKGSVECGDYEFEEWNLGNGAFNYAPELAGFFALLKRDYGVETVVETGTYMGATTQWFSLLFDQVHTIELSDKTYAKASSLFKYSQNVQRHLGSSEKVLPSLLPKLIDQKILFYLDAHWNEFCPLLEELKEIGKTHRDRCIIVIDDVKVPGDSSIPFDRFGMFDCSFEAVRTSIEQIFSAYQIHYLIPKSPSSRAKLIILPSKRPE